MTNGPSRLEALVASLEPFSQEELDRRERGAQQMKERLQSMPFYSERAARGSDGYWRALYVSQVNC